MNAGDVIEEVVGQVSGEVGSLDRSGGTAQ